MIKENLDIIYNKICKGNNFGEKIYLVGATKTMNVETINNAISCGLEIVAENRVQEFLQKTDYIVGAKQHFIGHLQENKVKYLVGKVDLIQSVHSISLANKINNLAEKRNVVQNVLLEINVSKEESKSGFYVKDIDHVLMSVLAFKNVKVLGFMAMLPLEDTHANKTKYCKIMRDIFDRYKDKLNLLYLSVGMSKDYEIAINNGSNMIRLGTSIFGSRL